MLTTSSRSLLLAGGLVALLAAKSPPAASPDTSGYDRTVGAAVSRAQVRFIRERTLHVDHSTWEDPWVVESRHYRVTNTRGYWLGRAVVDGLETMLLSFQRILDSSWAPSDPLDVYVFPDIATYNQFGNDFSDERSSISGSFYAPGAPAAPVVAMHGVNTTQTQMWITHAAAQQFVNRAFRVTPPTWISEGLGAYFSLYWDRGYGPSELRRLLDTDRYIPLEELIRAGIPQYTNGAHDRFMELGMFFTYLLHFREDTRLAPEGEEESPGSFASFLRATLAGENTNDHPFQELLYTNAAQIERDFKACDFGG